MISSLFYKPVITPSYRAVTAAEWEALAATVSVDRKSDPLGWYKAVAGEARQQGWIRQDSCTCEYWCPETHTHEYWCGWIAPLPVDVTELAGKRLCAHCAPRAGRKPEENDLRWRRISFLDGHHARKVCDLCGPHYVSEDGSWST